MKTSIEIEENLINFIEDVEFMQNLYRNSRFTQAELKRDELAEQLDDIMRLKEVESHE